MTFWLDMWLDKLLDPAHSELTWCGAFVLADCSSLILDDFRRLGVRGTRR